MTHASVTPIRAGTKALPEKVFDACDALAEDQGDFRNEEVLKLTGGGMATVARLVKLWRKNQHIIQANDTLSTEATITLVEMVDKLVQRQIAQSQSAVESFLAEGAEEMTVLGETLELRDNELASAKQDVTRLREQITQLDEQLVQAKTQLHDRERELADANARADRASDELKQTQQQQAAKLEQINSQHQSHLADALETQRRTMDAEKHDAMAKQETIWKERLADAKNDTAAAEGQLKSLQAELHTVTEERHQQLLLIQELRGELSSITRVHETQLEKQQALIDEKQAALIAAQNAQRELTRAIEQQRLSDQTQLDDHLRSLAGAASGVTDALAEIDALLKDIRHNTQTPPGNNTK